MMPNSISQDFRSHLNKILIIGGESSQIFELDTEIDELYQYENIQLDLKDNFK